MAQKPLVSPHLYSRPPVLAICTPIASRPTHQYTLSVRSAYKPAQKHPDTGEKLPGETHLLDVVGMPIVLARQALTASALATVPNLTHILWVDDDMCFQPDAIWRLLNHDLPIVGGLCHNRRPPSYQPILLKKFSEERRKDRGAEYGFIYDYPKGSLLPVDATGAAFLLVKREVFDHMDGQEWWTPRGNVWEDISFCERARDAGFPAYVDTSLDIGHVGECMVDSAFAVRNRTQRFLDAGQE